jgi:hypothetical protein
MTALPTVADDRPEVDPVRERWQRLRDVPTPTSRFQPDSVDELPEPTQRWLRHSIAPGTPMYTSVELRMEGEIRLGTWRRFTARQIIRPGHGYVWAARTRVAGVPVSGYDALSPAEAQMRWRAAGLMPIISSGGSDVLESAAGRLAGESVFVPTAYSGGAWQGEEDPNVAVVTWRARCEIDRVRLAVAPNGSLRAVSMLRWGRPDGGHYARHPFGATFQDEVTTAGITIPRSMRAFWHWGTEREADGEFFRAEILSASFH